MRSTYAGEVMAKATIAGQRMTTLALGGKTYIKPPKELLADVAGNGGVTGLSGKWITGATRPTRRAPTRQPRP